MEDPNVPGDVTTGTPVGNERAKLIAKDAEHADFFTKYGEPDGFHFFMKAGSDGAFAVRVIQDLLGYNDDFVPAGVDIQAPQESNITGKLDNTGDVATKEHVEGESEAPATIDDQRE